MTKKEVEDKLRDFFKNNIKGQAEKQIEQWVNSEIRGLGYKKPIDLMQTEEGRQQIYDMIMRLEHGIIL